MSTDHKFEGWLGKDPSSVEGKMVWESYDPKPFEDTDVDIKISHCGVSHIRCLSRSIVPSYDVHKISTFHSYDHVHGKDVLFIVI